MIFSKYFESNKVCKYCKHKAQAQKHFSEDLWQIFLRCEKFFESNTRNLSVLFVHCEVKYFAKHFCAVSQSQFKTVKKYLTNVLEWKNFSGRQLHSFLRRQLYNYFRVDAIHPHCKTVKDVIMIINSWALFSLVLQSTPERNGTKFCKRIVLVMQIPSWYINLFWNLYRIYKKCFKYHDFI